MAECKSCEKAESTGKVVFSEFSFEAHEARHEREKKRLWILSIILSVMLLSSNLAWVIYESQFEETITTTTIEAEQDGAGVNIVGAGDIDYGAEG
jgi:hypothetical protein